MKKINGNLIVGLLFVGIMIFLLVFGNKLTNLTGFAISDGVDSGKKLGIEVGSSYVPGDIVNIKIILYDKDSNKISGAINYKVFNYYSEIVKEGGINSGEEILYELPKDAYQGPWKIIASHDDVETNQLFNVGELEKAEISLERDVLVIKNLGNSVYHKKILIYIGDVDQTADVTLEIGQTKRIKLTAPEGDYDIKVIEGNEEDTLEFKGIKLTGNVVGLERVFNDSFWKKYPMIIVFLGVVLLISIIVGVLKIKQK